MRFSGILNDTHQMFCGVWLGHEIVAKYETCSYSNTYAHVRFEGILNDTHQVFCLFFSTGTQDWGMKRSCSNTDAFVNYCRPKPKVLPIYVPKTVFKLPSGTHVLILGFLMKPNQMRKEKYQDKMHVAPAKSNQLPWVHLHFISNKSLLNTFKNLTLLLVRVCFTADAAAVLWKKHFRG